MLPLLRFASGCFNYADAVSFIILLESKRESIDKSRRYQSMKSMIGNAIDKSISIDKIS